MSFLSNLINPSVNVNKQVYNQSAAFFEDSAKQPVKLTLYLFESCPFCVKVMKVIRHMNLDIEIRDTLKSAQFEAELIHGGGKSQVPCLKISNDSKEHWMYESSDIIRYLEKKFA